MEAELGYLRRTHRVELDSVDESVFVYWAGVRGASAQGLAVGLAGSSDILLGNRRERDKLYVVDLNLPGTDAVSAARPDLWPLPQSHRERDVSRQDVVAQLTAELHTRNATG